MTFLSLMVSVMLVMMGSVCLLSLLTVGLLACHHMSRVTCWPSRSLSVTRETHTDRESAAARFVTREAETDTLVEQCHTLRVTVSPVSPCSYRTPAAYTGSTDFTLDITDIEIMLSAD